MHRALPSSMFYHCSSFSGSVDMDWSCIGMDDKAFRMLCVKIGSHQYIQFLAPSCSFCTSLQSNSICQADDDSRTAYVHRHSGSNRDPSICLRNKLSYSDTYRK